MLVTKSAGLRLRQVVTVVICIQTQYLSKYMTMTIVSGTVELEAFQLVDCFDKLKSQCHCWEASLRLQRQSNLADKAQQKGHQLALNRTSFKTVIVRLRKCVQHSVCPKQNQTFSEPHELMVDSTAVTAPVLKLKVTQIPQEQ